MRVLQIGSLLGALLLLVPLPGSAQVSDMLAGYMVGKDAGTQPKVLMPWAVSTSTITLLAAIDREPVTNNRVVRQAVVNAAIGVSVSYVVNRLWRPEPSPIRNVELRNSTEAYQDGFRRGFYESLGGRQMVSNMLGAITGSLIAGAIYMARKD